MLNYKKIDRYINKCMNEKNFLKCFTKLSWIFWKWKFKTVLNYPKESRFGEILNHKCDLGDHILHPKNWLDEWHKMSGSRSPTNYFENWKLKPGTWLNQGPWHHHSSCNTEKNRKRVSKVVHLKKKNKRWQILSKSTCQIHLLNSDLNWRK